MPALSATARVVKVVVFVSVSSHAARPARYVLSWAALQQAKMEPRTNIYRTTTSNLDNIDRIFNNNNNNDNCGSSTKRNFYQSQRLDQVTPPPPLSCFSRNTTSAHERSANRRIQHNKDTRLQCYSTRTNLTILKNEWVIFTRG